MPDLIIRASSAEGLFPSGGPSSLQADLQASRLSGPAPLAVLFDATGTASTAGINTFRQVGYSFNFGEPELGNWTHSGISKNVQRGGPLAAHVFDTPGTKTVKLKARDSSGGSTEGHTSQVEVTITVQDPDVYFSSAQGRETVVISRNTDFTGAPAGATQIPNATSWPAFASNKRYLLRAGQDFSSLGTIRLEQRTDIQVGKFGTGADPIISAVAIEPGNPNSAGTNWSDRLVVRDLDSNGAITSGNSHSEVLVLRCKTRGIAEWGGTVGYYYINPGAGGNTIRNAIKHVRNCFMVECDISGGYNGYTASGRGIVLLGCYVHDPAVEHTSRVWQAYKSVFAHNRYTGARSGRHHFKMHGGGGMDWNDQFVTCPEPATNYVIIADNRVGTGSNDFPFTCGPQNTTISEPPMEGCENVIYERNVCEVNYAAELNMGGRNMIERGNSNLSGVWNYSDNYNQIKLPAGWGQSYYHSPSPIQTEDPT